MDLTKSALDILLAYLDTDREKAGEQYQQLRLKLIKFFEWKGCYKSEEYADKAITIVARKLEAGEVIHNLSSYIHGVRRLLVLECLKDKEREYKAIEHLSSVQSYPSEAEEKEAQRLCQEKCLQELPYDQYSLITNYYRPGIKKEERQILAEHWGLQLNAMRIRAFRIRQTLTECLEKCLGRKLAG